MVSRSESHVYRLKCGLGFSLLRTHVGELVRGYVHKRWGFMQKSRHKFVYARFSVVGGDFVPYFSASTPTASAGYCDSVDGILDGFKPPRDIPEDILSETSSSSSSSSCCSLTQPQLPLKAECRLAHPSAFFQQNVTHLSESVDDGLGSPLVYSALSNGTETQQPSVEEGAECRKVIRSIYGERDFSRCHNLPPLKDNEVRSVACGFW